MMVKMTQDLGNRMEKRQEIFTKDLEELKNKHTEMNNILEGISSRTTEAEQISDLEDSSVQFSHSVMSSSLRPQESQHTRPPCPSPTPSSLKLMSIESVMPSSHLILCCPLLLPPPIPPSIRVFSNESTLRMRWPKYWSFSFSIGPSKEHPGL